MGEANRRGSYEERVIQAMEERSKRNLAAYQARIERIASMPARAIRGKSKSSAAALAAMAMGIGLLGSKDKP